MLLLLLPPLHQSMPEQIERFYSQTALHSHFPTKLKETKIGANTAQVPGRWIQYKILTAAYRSLLYSLTAPLAITQATSTPSGCTRPRRAVNN